MIRRRSRRGGSAVEFALTAPAFVLLLGAFIDFGWVFFQQAMLDNAIAKGCRAGAVTDPSREDPETVADNTIKASLANLGTPCTGDCTVKIESRGVRPALSLYCAVDQAYTPLFGLVPQPERLSSSTLIRYEWQDEMAELLAEAP